MSGLVRPAKPANLARLTIRITFQTEPAPSLDSENKKGTMFCIRSSSGRAAMLKIFLQEAAALASITLFVGMIAVWAQLITQF